MRFRTLARAAAFTLAAQTATVPANAHDLPGSHIDGKYQCLTGYKELGGADALDFLGSLGISRFDDNGPTAEIRVTQDAVSITADGGHYFRTVTIEMQQTSVTTTDVSQQKQDTTILKGDQASTTSQNWTRLKGPFGTATPLQPLRPDEVQGLANRALEAIDRYCGPHFRA